METNNQIVHRFEGTNFILYEENGKGVTLPIKIHSRSDPVSRVYKRVKRSTKILSYEKPYSNSKFRHLKLISSNGKCYTHTE